VSCCSLFGGERRGGGGRDGGGEVWVGIGRGWSGRGWSGRRAWGGVGEGMGVREKFGVDAKTLIVVCIVNSIGH
jgi:hypothetical protein